VGDVWGLYSVFALEERSTELPTIMRTVTAGDFLALPGRDLFFSTTEASGVAERDAVQENVSNRISSFVTIKPFRKIRHFSTHTSSL
jgi:hypothetical protein